MTALEPVDLPRAVFIGVEVNIVSDAVGLPLNELVALDAALGKPLPGLDQFNTLHLLGHLGQLSAQSRKDRPIIIPGGAAVIVQRPGGV